MSFERTFCTAEIEQLEELLQEIPSENVIERIGLEHRLIQAKNRLKKLPEKRSYQGQLVFKGAPVRGSRSIQADFFGYAITLFSDAYAAVAEGMRNTLHAKGRIPNREEHHLHVTATARGSFGFVFEAPSDELPLLPNDEPSSVVALKHIENLFQSTAKGSDEDIAELLESIEARGVKQLHKFLDLLSKNNAYCELRYGERIFKYTSVDDVKRSANRLKDDNIKEVLKTFRGTLLGILPDSMTFEFKITESSEIIKGKLSSEIEEAESLYQQWQGKEVQAIFRTRQVGDSAPRYILKSIDNLRDDLAK